MFGGADDSLMQADEGREARERARRARPFVFLAVAMMVGVLVGRAWPWGAMWVVAAGAPMAGMGVMLLRGHGRAALIWGLLAVVMLMAGWQVWRAEHVAADHIARYATRPAQLAEVTGRVVELPSSPARDVGAFAAFDYRPPVTRTVVAVDGVAVGPARQFAPASGRVLLRVGEVDHRLKRGQRIRAVGWLGDVHGPSNPGEFDYREHLRSRGIVGRLSLPSRSHWQLLEEPSVWSPARLQILRDDFAATLQRSLRLGMAEDERSLALLEAVLLGIWGRELADTYESFRRVGLAHLLAISGAHLGILLGLVWMVVRVVVPYPRWAAMIVLVVLGLYLLALPVRVPIMRAAIMAAVFCVGYASGRKLPAMAMLAIAMIAVLLWRPSDLFTPGFQLSFGIVAGLIVFARPVRRWLWPTDTERLGDARTARQAEPARLSTMLLYRGADYGAANVVAFVIALPVVAYHFQMVSPLAIVMSLLALPVVTAVLALGYLKMVVGLLLPSVSIVLAGPAMWLSDSLLGLVDHAEHWPGAWLELTHTPSAAWVMATSSAGVALLAGAYAGRRKALAASAGVLLLWAVAVERDWATLFKADADRPVMTLHSFSVGHGSAHLVQFDGRAILFDCGSHAYPLVGSRTVAPGLRRLGVRELDTVFVSHAHLDHFNGLLELADRIAVHEVLLTPAMWQEAHEQPWRATGVLLAGLRERSVPVRAAYRGWARQYDNVQLRLLWPPADKRDFDRVNDTSLVLAIDHVTADRRLLLTGDIEAQAIAGLLAREPGLRADVVEMPHHGEYSDAGITLLDALQPSLLVQSSDLARLRRDRWPRQLDAMGLGDAPRLTTADHGMVTVQIHPTGEIRWHTFREPERTLAIDE
ncbi:ComEC/Rec2 family competence protein [Phycisphaerales bacterium AB-hyl4]|uniref:ComEC/Rec2 family competence protein n=1 Tax=Natronomicrosphaera hydrolytica TaxID=3242702 RepID=A0ABV4UA88_9BACT